MNHFQEILLADVSTNLALLKLQNQAPQVKNYFVGYTFKVRSLMQTKGWIS